ncbi:IQ domain-containing protein G, partial [Ophiophagus hannah]
MATPSFRRRESGARESWIWIKNTTPKLPPLDAIRLSAVLEDCTDQLAILGYIMPVSYEGRKDVEDVSVVPGCERVTDGCLQGNRILDAGADLEGLVVDTWLGKRTQLSTSTLWASKPGKWNWRGGSENPVIHRISFSPIHPTIC